MQNSSTLILLVVLTPWRRRKLRTLSGDFFFRREEGIAEFLLKVAVQVEIGAARVDHDFGGVVVEEKRHVHALGGYLDPSACFCRTASIPRLGCGGSSRGGP